MPLEKIEKIAKITKKAAKPVDLAEVQEPIRMAPNKEHFDNLMTQKSDTDASKTSAKSVEAIEPVTKSSLMDEVRNLNQKVDRIGKVTPKDLIAQSEDVINHIKTIKEKLATPNLEISQGTQTLLQNKLSHIDENLRVALSKAGVEYTGHTEPDKKLVNPIDRFMGFLTHGQDQLGKLAGEVERMHLNKQEISPANMLRIQVKIGFIQQQLEFFSNVLNQTLQSTKTIMNVQV